MAGGKRRGSGFDGWEYFDGDVKRKLHGTVAQFDEASLLTRHHQALYTQLTCAVLFAARPSHRVTHRLILR